MQASVRIQNDGQAIIPAEVIQHLGGHPGAELIIEIDSNHAMLRVDSPIATPHPIYTRDIPPEKSVQDFLDEYEKKYQMKSEEFWQKYKAGELECEIEFIDWAGHYEHKLYLDSIGVDPRTVTFESFVPEGEKTDAARL